MVKVANPSKRRKHFDPGQTVLRDFSGVLSATPPPSACPPARFPKPITSAFASTLDGHVFLNVAHCVGRALDGRTLYTFTGVLLNPDETKLARDGLRHAASDVAAKIASTMPSVWTLPAPTKAPNDTSKTIRYRVPRKGKPARS
jgi:hypothetical protein